MLVNKGTFVKALGRQIVARSEWDMGDAAVTIWRSISENNPSLRDPVPWARPGCLGGPGRERMPQPHRPLFIVWRALLNSGMILPPGPQILLSFRHKSTNAIPDGDFGLPLGGQNLTACGTSPKPFGQALPTQGEVYSPSGEPLVPNLTGFRFLSLVKER